MGDLTKLTEENTNRVLDLVEELQPVAAQRVQEELEERYGVQADVEQVTRYMEWLRSGFPRKLSHAGPDLWIAVDLS